MWRRARIVAWSISWMACTPVSMPGGAVDGGSGFADASLPPRVDAGSARDAAAERTDSGVLRVDGGVDAATGPSEYPTTECISTELNECIALPPAPATQIAMEPSSAAGGQPFDETCPEGQVLIGFDGTMFAADNPNDPGRTYLAGFRPRCGALEVGAHPPHLVKVTPIQFLTNRGAEDGGGGDWESMCARDQVVVGYQVRSTGSVRSLRIACAAVSWMRTAPGEGEVLVGAPVTLPWTVEHDGEIRPEVPCPDDSVAMGVHGRSGAWIDGIGLSCRRFGFSLDAECASDEITECIATVTTGQTGTALRPADATGGNAFDDDCPAGQVLVGFQMDFTNETNGYPSGVRGRCAALDVSEAEPRLIALSEGTTLDRHGGGAAAAPVERMCPQGQVVVGFEARTGIWVDALALRCAPVAWIVGSEAEGLAPGGATALPWAGESDNAPSPPVDCLAPQVAIGVRGRSGGALDAFGLRCGLITRVGD